MNCQQSGPVVRNRFGRKHLREIQITQRRLIALVAYFARFAALYLQKRHPFVFWLMNLRSDVIGPCPLQAGRRKFSLFNVLTS